MAPYLSMHFKQFALFSAEFGLLPEQGTEPVESLLAPAREKHCSEKQQHDKGVI